MRRFLLEKSFAERSFAHRMNNVSFLPLLPVASLSNKQQSVDAAALGARMNAEFIPAFDRELWSEWEEMEKVLDVLDDEPIDFFEKIIYQNYYVCLRKILERPPTPVLAYTPRVPIEHAATPMEVERRRALLLNISAKEGVAAEERVLLQWVEFVHSCNANVSSMLDFHIPPVKFWQRHLYDALFAVQADRSAKRTGSHSVQTSSHSLPEFDWRNMEIKQGTHICIAGIHEFNPLQ